MKTRTASKNWRHSKPTKNLITVLDFIVSLAPYPLYHRALGQIRLAAIFSMLSCSRQLSRYYFEVKIMDTPFRPALNDRAGWRAFWDVQGLFWRNEPEIRPERQQTLA